MASRRAFIGGFAASTLLSGCAHSPLFTEGSDRPEGAPLSRDQLKIVEQAQIPLTRPGARRVTEFFDYNCGYCRASVEDVAAIVAKPGVQYSIVHFPALGSASEGAARTVLAFTSLYGPERAFALHRSLARGVGMIDAQKPIREVERHGADAVKVAELAESDAIRRQVAAGVAAAQAIGARGTPSYVVHGQLYQGQIDPSDMQAILRVG